MQFIRAMQFTTAAILDALPQPAVLIGSDGRFARLNAQATSIFGDRVTGRRFGIAIREPRLREAIDAVLAGRPGRIVRVALRQTSFDVDVRPLGAGETAGVLLLYADIKAVEEGLRQKQNFVSDASHELRTPLTALSGLLDTLAGAARDDAEAARRFTAMMRVEVDRMIGLVDDLLRLARLDAGAEGRGRAEVALSELLNAEIRMLQTLASDKGFTVSVAPMTGPDIVIGDRDALRQVVVNLVTNAILHSGGTTVTVGVEPADRAALGRPALRLWVRDDGAGIATEHLPRLTERFYRVDTHRGRTGSGGTGLGLAIVKHIVQRHGGRLRITSEPGQGACFEVFLPSAEGR